MSFFDRAINAASAAARSSAENYRRAQQRRALLDQIAMHQQTIAWSLSRVGRSSLDAHRAGRAPLPQSTASALNAISAWEKDITALQQQLANLDAQAAAYHTGQHPTVR